MSRAHGDLIDRSPAPLSSDVLQSAWRRAGLVAAPVLARL